MPQGSVLSPTLYSLYTNDQPSAGPGCLITLYADDITQVITTPSKSRNMMRLNAEREIERINRYEKKMWKIRTSEKKFKILPIARYKSNQKITVNGRDINTCTEGKFLGLKLQTRGIVGHATEKLSKGKGIISGLRRFDQLTPKLKATLIKTLFIPVLEYPFFFVYQSAHCSRHKS